MEMGKENFSYSHWRTSRDFWNEQLLREKKITNSYVLKKLLIGTITFIFISCGISRKVIVEKESSKKNKIESKIDSQTITKAKKNYVDCDFNSDDSYVFGSESSGINQSILDDFDEDSKIFIPMFPNVRSINICNSVSILAYENLRQNNFSF